jgi:Protein of unknown function (DUF3379)
MKKVWACFLNYKVIGILLGIGVVYLAYYHFFVPINLADEVMVHVEHEPQSLIAREHHQQTELNGLLKVLGIRFSEDIGVISYLKSCPVSTANWVHAVIQTASGPATLMFIPAASVNVSSSIDYQGKSDHNVALVRSVHQGYYAIVASTPQALKQVDQFLRNKIAP